MRSCTTSRFGLLAALLMTAGLATPALAADEVKIGGSGTVGGLIEPLKSTVEKATGAKVTFYTSNTGKGIVDLLEKRVDLAMYSEPQDVAEMTAKNAVKDAKTDGLQWTEIGQSEIVIVVHPSNAVSKLSKDQVKDIFLGKTKNWKEVGGADAPIVVFTEKPAGGTRVLTEKFFLGGEKTASGAKELDAVKKVGTSVADFKNGIGALGVTLVDKAKNKIVETDKLPRPLGFATIGAPTPAQQKVIDAFKAELAKVK